MALKSRLLRGIVPCNIVWYRFQHRHENFQIRQANLIIFSEMKETQRACSEVPSRLMKVIFHVYSRVLTIDNIILRT